MAKKDEPDRGSPRATDPDRLAPEAFARLRLKLLDLTTRNPLIAYRHSARGRRSIRVIDELPNQLFARMTDDVGMRFRSLGRVPNEPEDEKTVIFRRAVAAAKLEDSEYRRQTGELGDDPGDKAMERLEQELRQRLREQLGMPARKANICPSPAETAQQQGLNPSFDLAASGGATAESHQSDGAIQTLLFEDDMQASLGRMRDLVRLSLDEAGVNPLFGVFGFLEWYEDTNSEVPRHAPILLCPLGMDRKLVRGQYQYMVRSTGEETQVNVAIAERLKRDFNLILPPFGENETPESYFTAVQRVIERQRGWKVRRWITIGLYSFARIAMYHDLAPEQWACTGGLEKHGGLARLIAGGTGEGSGALFDSTDGMAPQDDGELDVPLIADADSSQLMAVKDVLEGRTLVIEGPPGTGKSQTITNIIAASLAMGKTVLFLAEKMAALNVVRDRLVNAGLGDFCLELHSTKAGRKETAAALAKRLSRPRQPASTAPLQAALDRLKTLRHGLSRSVEALAQPAGKLGITTQELLWRCHTARQASREVPSEVDEIAVPGANELTEIDLGRIVTAVEQFERAIGAVVDTHGSVMKHPWNGVARHDIDPFRAEDIVRRVRRISEVADEAQQLFDQIAALSQVRLAALGELGQIGKARSIPLPEPLVSDDIVTAMADGQTLAAMEDFARELGELSSLNRSVQTAFATAESLQAASVSDLRAIAGALPEVVSGGATVGEIPRLLAERQQQATAWAAVSEFLLTIASRAGCQAPRTSTDERSLAASVELAASANPEMLANREKPLMAHGAAVVLRRAGQQAADLKQRRASLGVELELALLPDARTLREHARAIRLAPLVPYFSLAWWRARRAFRAMQKQTRRRGRTATARFMDDAAAYCEGVAAFDADTALVTCVGRAFKSINTDMAPLLRLTDWADRVRAKLPAGTGVNDHLRQLLFEGSPDQIESVAALANDPRQAHLREALAADAAGTNTVLSRAVAAAKSANQAMAISQAAQRLGLRQDYGLQNCGQLAEHLARAKALRESLDSSEMAKAVLGGRFSGHASDRDLIGACARHVRDVDAAQLPVVLRNWALGADSTARTRALRPIAERAHAVAISLEGALEDLAKVADTNFTAWLGSPSPYDVTAADLRDHARRCASDAGGFQGLIDEKRARNEVGEIGMMPLIDLLESRMIPLKGLACAARRVLFQSMARDAIARNPALANFTGDRHEASRQEFRALDQQLKRLRQETIADQIARRPVDPGSDAGSRRQWTGMALIRNEAAKQKGHAAVRDLMDRAGTGIQQLMPCFMMSPLSVAQFLKPGRVAFDLVVMDEASQLRLEDAIGAIGRSSQIVVVGDPKQLPPTNFFREADAVTDDDDAVEDEPSILDQAIAFGWPARRLKWHYRSRHASLIAFSNKEFYDSQLVVFPSPYHEHADLGVQYVHVADGLLRGRVNVPEATVVAKAALEYAALHPERSLGIVALNQPQAELLSLEIDRLATEHEEFEAWRQERQQSLEPFFVKNLENVQGDERDAIFISTVYGPDEPGKQEFAQRFGPINNAGGHRRLNVLFTRAKCQTRIFSSMDPSYMRTDAQSAWGVRALKGYLKFARDGVLDIPRETGHGADSDFEIAVMGALRAAGFDVVPQVGVVGYFIDLAVRHPSRSGEYAIGIECDGAMYHSSKSVRDRDRLRQDVLEGRKWRIHRIWSLDWYRNPKREIDRLLKAVNEAVAASG